MPPSQREAHVLVKDVKKRRDEVALSAKCKDGDPPIQIVPTILYVLSPIDILPEDTLIISHTGVFGLVGFIDDLLILLIAFLHLAALYRSILLYRHGGQ
ncbi:hypothetical protein MA16_Dca007725 [Dendrobium catenatum]|uniref:RING-type E3 ubiquitin transferase n=1 Tax=Dendrobium catenatum TaxID=906689 RepID=A0A2I0X553_9ASPA|nr:hypothetical protein MA16_Dca007725 [Dendrobium catenatum]